MSFHFKDGWYFKRLEDGSVLIYHEEPISRAECAALIDAQIEIDPGSWASIIASVSARGDTAETFREAVKFHTPL